MDQVQKLLTKVYRGIGTPLAKRAETYVALGEWSHLQQMTIQHPSAYLTASEYFSDVVVVDLTRKLLLPGDTTSRYEAAVKTFWAAEAQCAQTNARLTRFIDNQGPFGPSDERVIQFISVWRKEIRRVLGRASYVLEPRFSQGSTYSDKGKLTTIPDKLSSVQSTYHRTRDDLLLNYARTPQGESAAPERIRGNRFFTVPKDSSKDRGCCVEASMNIGLQLAVGQNIRHRYNKRYRLDITQAQGLHRDLARRASSGELSLSTIDLSNASDTVASSLIKLLLPRDWYELLNSLRAPVTFLDGKAVFLQKFSSMGNGFTFELETLVFRTMLAALGCENAWCYGDDIIVDQNRSADVLNALKFFGFTPNEKKTFCEGPFRESCGGDFFNGQAVRPYFLKELPSEPQHWVKIHNGLKRLNDHRLNAAIRFCVDQLPISWRLYGPASLGDVVLHDDDALPVMKPWKSRESFWDNSSSPPKWRKVTIWHDPVPQWKVMIPVSQTFPLGKYWSYRVATAAACKGVPTEVATRDSVTGYRTSWVHAWGIPDDPAWWTESDA